MEIGNDELEELFSHALSNALSDNNISGNIIIIPPDSSRIHSRAGFLTEIASKRISNRLGAVLPALGTHMPMSGPEITAMFGSTPKEKFIVHNWRKNVTELGRINTDTVERITEGAVNYSWPVQVNKILVRNNPQSGNFSLAISIGQVVPHEVAGMANHAKNLFIGTGGKEAIDKSHFAGAVYGMEKIMGRINTPVRALFDEGIKRFSSQLPQILWVLTVADTNKEGCLVVRGFFAGFGRECFEYACSLAGKINIKLLNEPADKVLVNLDSSEYKSTWLCNKAIYRTRMCIADGGELIILAPALEKFAEDKKIDKIIRKYGYRGKDEIISLMKNNPGLADNLCAAAHLIHGSSEGRFTIRYCPGEKISRKEIERAGFEWGDLGEAYRHYDINSLHSGWNNLSGGENVYYAQNPALCLWAENKRFFMYL